MIKYQFYGNNIPRIGIIIKRFMNIIIPRQRTFQSGEGAIQRRDGKEFVGLEKTGATGFSKTISMFMEVNQNGKY